MLSFSSINLVRLLVDLLQGMFSYIWSNNKVCNFFWAELVFLSSNNLSGPLPGAKLSTQANPKKLRGLYLSDNDFTGIIPEQLCGFKSLQALFLDGNDQLAGSIPPCLSQLVNLLIEN